MKHLIIASPTILAALIVLAISLHALYRARRENEAHKAECERRTAELDQQVAQREAELIVQLATKPAELVMNLDLSDEDPFPDLVVATQNVQTLVSGLSQQEQSLGGSGLMLTAARVEPGELRLTLSPVERIGSAERVRCVAEEWNAHGGPLPPGVIAARADVLAA